MPQTRPGVLSFQGDFAEHLQVFKILKINPIKVRTVEDLDQVTHLVIPGGESTVIGKFLAATTLDKIIQKKVQKSSLAVYGTCAGAILLATQVESHVPINNLGLMNLKISRNAYGSQLNSFSQEMEFALNNQISKKFTAVFIRAPRIIKIGAGVKPLVKNQAGEVFAARKNRVMVTTFHPEINQCTLFHEYFLDL